MLHKIPVILASKSPRRKHLLEDAGFDVEVMIKEVDESFPIDMPVQDVAEFIAKKKADAFSDLKDADHFIITADSIVVKDGKIYGKPDDKADAIQILNILQGSVHQVYTGVCIRKQGKVHSFTELADVTMEAMSREEIEFYLDLCQPYDKAGAYGIQDWIGLCKVSKIEGTMSNIMGLPIYKIYQIIQNWQNIVS